MDVEPAVEDAAPAFENMEEQLAQPEIDPEMSVPEIKLINTSSQGSKIKQSIGSKRRRKLLANAHPSISPVKHDVWSNEYDIDMDVQDMSNKFQKAKLQSSEKKHASF